MASNSNKETYDDNDEIKTRVSKVLNLGLISAASAFAGGLAMAWWYRKTLTKLQNPIASTDIQNSEHLRFEGDIQEREEL
jgi:hypothetical protein